MAQQRVYCRLIGGLGNQLFQYATARAVSLRTGAELVLDARVYSSSSAFDYGLGNFEIVATLGDDRTLPPPKSSPLRYAFWRTFGSSPRFIREQGLGFNRRILDLEPDVYLHGYFQSEMYFEDAAAQIRSELVFASPATGENDRWLEEISGSPGSVSLHVRRGDYISSSKGQTTHGTCSPDYYRSAVELIADGLERAPTIYVFSDDPQWAGENLSFPFETRIASHNDGSSAHEDLRLMAACSHSIIANSTFSWWGAWLNPNPQKTVITPKRWFSDPKLHNPDIVPAGWNTI